MIGKIKAVLKKVLIGACVAVVIIIFIMINSGPTIYLNNYLVFETDGYDGYGTVKASIDWDAIKQKYGKKLNFVVREKMSMIKFIILYHLWMFCGAVLK